MLKSTEILQPEIKMKGHRTLVLFICALLLFIARPTLAETPAPQVDLPQTSESAAAAPAGYDTNATNHNEVACPSPIDPKDPVTNHKGLKDSLSRTFIEGEPYLYKIELIRLRGDIDLLWARFYDLKKDATPEEIKVVVQEAVNKVSYLMNLIPKMSHMAHEVGPRVVLPFTHINSLVADHIDCINSRPVAEGPIKSDGHEQTNAARALDTLLTRLNSSLHDLETFNSPYQNFRALLVSTDEDGVETLNIGNLQQIPTILNSMQRDIEMLLPALELPKTYSRLTEQVQF